MCKFFKTEVGAISDLKSKKKGNKTKLTSKL